MNDFERVQSLQSTENLAEVLPNDLLCDFQLLLSARLESGEQVSTSEKLHHDAESESIVDGEGLLVLTDVIAVEGTEKPDFIDVGREILFFHGRNVQNFHGENLVVCFPPDLEHLSLRALAHFLQKLIAIH